MILIPYSTCGTEFKQSAPITAQECFERSHSGEGTVTESESDRRIKVGGSNPSPATTNARSGPDTWVTECTGYMGNSFGPKGFSSGSKTLVSKSK